LDLRFQKANAQALLPACTLIALVFGVLSGIRWPGIWAITHLLFDYSEGFVKRSLVGEALSLTLGNSISYGTLAAISYAVFATWLAMLFFRLKSSAQTDSAVWLIALTFLASPGFVFLAHTVGYLEHVGLIFVFLCLQMPVNVIGWFARVAVIHFDDLDS